MPVCYLDSSALVKRYIRELGSSWIDGLYSRETITMSSLSKVELASVLARRVREGTLSSEQRDVIYRRFLLEARSYAMTGLSAGIIRDAAALLRTTPNSVALRSLDALHLVSARWSFARARRSGLVETLFVASDRTLLNAAQWAGLPIANPEDHP